MIAFVTVCVGAQAGAPAARGTAAYAFGGALPQAVAYYRQGWVEILEFGRWQEAERHYRAAVAADPGFTLAKSVLARITTDTRERDALYREVQARMPGVDEDARLLLTTYQATLELFAKREAGETLPDDARTVMARRAVVDYGEFLRRHPAEWSVMIEYVEWIHALDGPRAALDAVARLRSAADPSVSFSYFPAWFHAELGEIETARELARAFRTDIADDSSPQPDYLDAFIHFQSGDLDAAAAAVDRALRLDPRHLLAARLQQRIESAR